MIYIFSSHQPKAERIKRFVLAQTPETFRFFSSDEELRSSLKGDKPKAAFIYDPLNIPRALHTQKYIRAVLPHCRVRILPTHRRTQMLLEPYWRQVVLDGLKIKLWSRNKIQARDSL